MAVKGHSASLHYGNGADYSASTSFTKLAGVTELTPPTVDAEKIDVSNMDSPQNYMENDAGEASVSDVECTLQYEKERNEDVLELFRVPKGFKVVFSDGSHWGFSGFISSVGNETERKGIVSLKIKITVSGKPIFVKATA